MSVVKVAIRCSMTGKVWSLESPCRHHDVLRTMWSQDAYTGSHEQGFLLDTGVFVGREQAWIEAQKCGQLLPRAPTDGQGGTLYSEDVW